MGSSKTQNKTQFQGSHRQDSQGRSYEDPYENWSPMRQTLPTSPPPSIESDRETCRGTFDRDAPDDWRLPLESIVLEKNIGDIPLNFLNVYGAILQKFPGPPCEALGKAITYMQALFTDSPGFHPYITHMPSNSLPTHLPFRKSVAEALERKLIRVVQHLLAFFYGDVNYVIRYINACPAELIPKPLFIVSDPASGPNAFSQLKSMAKGVRGFNNSIPGGAAVWRSPSYSGRIEEQEEILKRNLQRCAEAINQKRGFRLPTPEAQPSPIRLGPNGNTQCPPTGWQFNPTSVNFTGPTQIQPPMLRVGQPTRGHSVGPPQIFHVPHPEVLPPPALPQPNPPPVQPSQFPSPAADIGPRAPETCKTTGNPSVLEKLNFLESKVAELREYIRELEGNQE